MYEPKTLMEKSVNQNYIDFMLSPQNPVFISQINGKLSKAMRANNKSLVVNYQKALNNLNKGKP